MEEKRMAKIEFSWPQRSKAAIQLGIQAEIPEKTRNQT
jgi:hypothetical protein